MVERKKESEVAQSCPTVAYQAPLSMGFSRQEYWSGLPFPSPGHLIDQGVESVSPTLQADALLSEPPGKSVVDRVPKELWMEVHNIVQEAVTKTIPKKKKCKEAKWLSEEALQIVEDIKEVKGKREKEKTYPTECRVPENSKW